MKMWSWEQISATEVQEYAGAAFASGVQAWDIADLAGLGAHGRQKGNVHRDLMRLCFQELRLPCPYVLKTKLEARGNYGRTATGVFPVHCFASKVACSIGPGRQQHL